MFITHRFGFFLIYPHLNLAGGTVQSYEVSRPAQPKFRWHPPSQASSSTIKCYIIFRYFSQLHIWLYHRGQTGQLRMCVFNSWLQNQVSPLWEEVHELSVSGSLGRRSTPRRICGVITFKELLERNIHTHKRWLLLLNLWEMKSATYTSSFGMFALHSYSRW